jgi:predicted helicase
MSQLNLKPTHAAVKNYYAALHQLGQLHIDHEMAVRSAFQDLLSTCGRKLKLTLSPEFEIKRKHSSIRVDAALLDEFKLAHGFWEAKDEKDDLDREIKSKLEKGYPRDNIIFQAPNRAVLYQSGTRIIDADISNPENLTQIVNQFFDYKAPHIEEWEQAVAEFSDRIPELSDAVKKIIDEERRRNPAFVRTFDDFYALCRQAINPNLSEDAVERMLIQHLLTERIFERIFDNPDFTRRNVVAAEIEKVIVELTKRAFNRNEFLRPLDRFYKAIETSAENTTGFTEKQHFLNKVYERFFQGYSPKEADTHGIVYTPQPIVNFMVRSVEEILQKEFGRSLGDKNVHILDPFVGTGNFIVNIMDKIKATELPYKYENELHCNEVMLLPYYIASMNIEHAYFERTGEYSAFPGICLVDTFELAESKQVPMFTQQNTQRVEHQKRQQIFVVIGNPPYNSKQLDESDQNQNRTYPTLDARIADTYTADSTATLRNKLSDPYVRAFRWASDRVGEQGVVALVTNGSYIDQIAFDGMRKHLLTDFDAVYVLELGGNVRKNAKLSGTTHNVFGIQIGVAIALLVRTGKSEPVKRRLFYARTDEFWTRHQKYDFLDGAKGQSGIQWRALKADSQNNWLLSDSTQSYLTFVPLGDKSVKRGTTPSGSTVFQLFSLGVVSSRDAYAYNFSASQLSKTARIFVNVYEEKLSVAQRKKADPDSLIDVTDARIKWTRQTKAALLRGAESEFKAAAIRDAAYRPFTKMTLYFDDFWNEEQYRFREIFPIPGTERENTAFCATGPGAERPFACLACSNISDLNFFGPGTVPQWFPFYTYAEDGTHRRENITDWALEQFRSHYHAQSITKWDIFHYVYAVLHHPEYRERYAANLRRELPRIPFAPVSSVSPVVKDVDVFRQLVKAGKRLAEIHVHYEQQPGYPLTQREKAGTKLDWRVTKMRLSKDKATLIYNDFLTLSEIPKETYDYRLGNRSALEWVIDQYQVSTDKRSGITNDPNRADDPQYILRLIGQVITVSLETVKIVQSLPSLRLKD